jgi:general secretion pathway protein I
MRSRRGFTLLEVMVATTIMGIAVVTLMSGLTTSVRNASRLTDYDRAALLARARMDSLLVEPKLPQGMVLEEAIDPALLGGARGGARARLTPFEIPQGAGPGSPCLDRVQLEIWWMSGDQRRSFSLEGFRRGVVPAP